MHSAITPLAARRARLAELVLDTVTGCDGDLRPAARVAARQGLVLSRGQLRDLGLPDARVRSLVRRRVWCRPRRGVVGIVGVVPTVGDADRWLPAALAGTATAIARPGVVVSHDTAAALLGVPLLRDSARPLVTVAPSCSCPVRDDVDVHAAALDSDEIVRVLGVRMTSPARTAVDLARRHGVAAGVVALDAVLTETPPDVLDGVLVRQAGWPYVRRAERAVRLADGGSESVLESLVRVKLVTSGLPRPELQVWIDTELGPFRVDMLWQRRRVVLEADGLAKYRAGWETLVAEKRRQEALEHAGYRVVRVTWRELTTAPRDVVARVAAALA